MLVNDDNSRLFLDAHTHTERDGDRQGNEKRFHDNNQYPPKEENKHR